MNTNRDVAELGLTRRRPLQAAAATGAAGDITANTVDPAAAATTVGSTTDAQLFQDDAHRAGNTAAAGPPTRMSSQFRRMSAQRARVAVLSVVECTGSASGVNDDDGQPTLGGKNNA